MRQHLRGIAWILTVTLNIAAGWTFIGLAVGAVGALLVFSPDRK